MQLVPPFVVTSPEQNKYLQASNEVKGPGHLTVMLASLLQLDVERQREGVAGDWKAGADCRMVPESDWRPTLPLEALHVPLKMVSANATMIALVWNQASQIHGQWRKKSSWPITMCCIAHALSSPEVGVGSIFCVVMMMFLGGSSLQSSAIYFGEQLVPSTCTVHTSKPPANA